MMKFNVGIRAGWSRRDQEGLRAAKGFAQRRASRSEGLRAVAAKARSEGLRPRRGKDITEHFSNSERLTETHDVFK